MGSDLLQPLQILTKFALHSVCQDLGVFAINNVTLSVEKPGRDFVLSRVLNDGNNALKLFGSDFTSAFVQVNIGLLADQVGVSSPNTLDLGQGVHDLLFAIDVGVEEAENELEVRLLA